MKKYLFMILAAVAAISFSSCEPQQPVEDPEQEGIVLKISPDTLELAIGDETRVRCLTEPAGANVTITYTSDNEAVATVTQAGLVTGVAAGTANIIASAEGAKSDTCVVIVLDASDVFAWGGMVVLRDESYEVLSNDTIIEMLDDGTPNGRPVKCILVSASGMAWDDNIFIDKTSETGMSGKGYIAFIDMVPVLQILDSIDEKGPNFYYFGANTIEFVDGAKFNPHDTAYAYCAAAGIMLDAAKQLEYYSNEDENAELEMGIGGTEIWEITDASSFSGYPTVGLVGTGLLLGTRSEAFYRMNIGWFEDESAYGLKLVKNGDKYNIKEPAEWAEINYKEYTKLPQASATSRKLKIQAPDSQLEKTIKRMKKIKTDRLYKK